MSILIDALLIIKEELNVPYIPPLFETFLKEKKIAKLAKAMEAYGLKLA